MLIQEMPESERPREKLLQKGASSLSDAEIMAVFFSTGRQGKSAVDLGREIIERFGNLRNLSRATAEELCEIPGIGEAKATQLLAVFEFGRRLSSEKFSDSRIESPEDVMELLGTEMRQLQQESVRVIKLNSRNELLHVEEIFRGSGTQSIARPKEILQAVIRSGAEGFILAHNHPSGNIQASEADIHLTKRLREAAQHIGINLVDHVIIGFPGENQQEDYFSFREAGLL